MRKVYYGPFIHEVLPEYDPDLPIGMHSIIRHQTKEALHNAGCEYYIEYKGHKVPIKDASMLEKISARVKYLFKLDKRLIVGSTENYGDKIQVGDNTCTCSIKTKVNEQGKTVIDEDHYKKTIEEGRKYQLQKEREYYSKIIDFRRKKMESRINSEVERFEKIERLSSRLLQLPFMQDIIDYELSKVYIYDPGVSGFVLKDLSKQRMFNAHRENGEIVIQSYTLDLIKGKAYDEEFYTIAFRSDGYKIEIGDRTRFCPDGLRIYADRDGNMTKAEFRMNIDGYDSRVVEIPMAKPCMDSLDKFINYQRDLERIGKETVTSLILGLSGYAKSKTVKEVAKERKEVWSEIVKKVEELKQYNPKRNLLLK